jgi:tetratricopeptide (TPR) repeat protein
VVSYSWGPARCSAQEGSTSDAKPSIGQTLAAKQPPFDRLELLAFVVGTFYSPYVAHEIENRGISFVPDVVFLKEVRGLGRGPGIVEAIKAATRQVMHKESAQVGAAYDALSLAIEFMRKSQYASADQEFQHALKLVPDSATLHLAYAANLIAVPKYAQTDEECRRSLQLWPENAEAHTLLAMSLVGQNRGIEAIPEAREALRLSPAHKSALIALAMALTRSRQFGEAIPVLRQAVPRTPEVPNLRKYLGVSLFHTGDIDGAIEQLTIFVEKQPDDAEGHYYLGASLRAKGRQGEAQRQFKEAVRIAPNNSVYEAAANPEGAQKTTDQTGPRPDLGTVTGNVYTNQFFGFSYEFPRGWIVQSADTAKAITQMAGAILSNGDPILQDAQTAASRGSYPLLFIQEGVTKDGRFGIRSVLVQAFNLGSKPAMKSAEEFTKDMVAFHSRVGGAIQPVGQPEEMQVNGKVFWRSNVNAKLSNGIVSEAEISTIEKGYILLFVFAGSDATSRDDLVKTLQSLRFVENP